MLGRRTRSASLFVNIGVHGCNALLPPLPCAECAGAPVDAMASAPFGSILARPVVDGLADGVPVHVCSVVWAQPRFDAITAVT